MTKSINTSAGSSGTSHERGERVLAKIAAPWSKNNKSISAAVTAAGEIGRAHVGNMVGWEFADYSRMQSSRMRQSYLTVS
jgi:hypothetical protein